MNKLKGILIISLLFSFIISSFGQEKPKLITVYKTFSDFQSGNGVEIGNMSSFYFGLRFIIKVYQENKTIKINDYWGYTVDSSLFRSQKHTTYPVRVMSVGHIVHYENGKAHMSYLLDEIKGGAHWLDESYHYYSVSLNSKILTKVKKLKKALDKQNKPPNELLHCLLEKSKLRSVQNRIFEIKACILENN